MVRRIYEVLLALCVVCVLLTPGKAQTAVATYTFDNTLSAQESGVPALTAVDPLGMNTFETATVFGQSQTVYHAQGAASPASQHAGLSLNTTGLIPTNNYSVEMVIRFVGPDAANGWKRILDVQNRASDNGLYLNSSNKLDIWNGGNNSGTTAIPSSGFYHVVLTNSGNVAKAYLNGKLEITQTPTVMDINNSSNLLNIFLDNEDGSGGNTGEYSDSRIALLRLYDGALTDAQVFTLAVSVGAPAVPAPGALLTALLGVIPGLGIALRHRRCR